MSVVAWIAAAALGGCGAILRFLLDAKVSSRLGRDFPYGTFVVNITGSVFLGLVVGATLAGDAAILIGTATIGSYTTFSTWMFETHRLAEQGEVARAFANAAVSLATGLAAVALGRALGGLL
ncbi:MAG: fluoride efflux transporter CrcB [Solirubrobacteraceae bacterium]